MNKETIRPLLVEELEKCRKIELEAHKGEIPEGWAGLEALLEARQAARLKRAQAEIQLWLADRQWEREELQRKLVLTEEQVVAAENGLPVSPATKA